MKKISVIMLAAIVTLAFVSCKKSEDGGPAYTCTTCTATPNALAANDASSKGVYKGIMIGSTGTIKLDVMNGGTTISAVLVLDGTTINLTSAISWVAGESYVAPFTGTLNGSPISVTFSVDATGHAPVITSSSIPGHASAQFNLVKETSAALIEVFEGEYSTTEPETGTFNIFLSRPLAKWGGSVRKDGATSSDDINGTIVNGKVIDDGGEEVGTLTGDKIFGSFKDSNNKTVTINAKRTL